ncbi:MAG: hypothetical protein CSA35_00955 [Dethiosulfovibrio peptidovorans]|nr:MAG: hypothetical protein CSA35_00955 [Dethiosulfovibrio peptidovorans]
MKKINVIILSMAVVLVTFVASSAFAHDLWVWGENGKNFNADIIYGHDFPNPEKIKPERVKIFAPIKVISENGEIVLKQTGEHKYHYEGKKLKKGAYVLSAFYKPTAWIQTSDGQWEMGKTRKDTEKEVKYCEIATMQSKALISVDGGDSKIIKKAFGKHLEITPLFDSINDLRVGNLLEFKITLDGKPAKLAEIFGSFGGYAKVGEGYDHSKVNMAFAAYAKSDLQGRFYFQPLKKGLWFLKSEVTEKGNGDCENLFNGTTLVFEVK